MKTWQKVVVATVGSGFIGGLTYSAGLYPEWSAVMSYVALSISGIMSIVIGFPPKVEV